MTSGIPSARYLAVHQYEIGVYRVPFAVVVGRAVLIILVLNLVQCDVLVAERAVPYHALGPYLYQQAGIHIVCLAVGGKMNRLEGEQTLEALKGTHNRKSCSQHGSEPLTVTVVDLTFCNFNVT